MNFNVLRWDGEPIAVPGIYADIPIRPYHKQLTVGPSLSGSGAKTLFHDSAAHYYEGSYLNPEREPEPANAALRFGRAAHHLILGEEAFARHFALRPETYPEGLKYEDEYLEDHPSKPWNANSHWCKGWLAEQAANDLDVVTTDELRRIRRMAANLEKHPLVQAGILSGRVEHSFVWQHPSGVWLKARPDNLPTSSLDFADLKTIADISDEGIERAIEYGYNMQAAFSAMACRALLGQELQSFSFVFVEKTAPYSVRVKTLREADIELGVRQVEAAVQLFARSLETGEWPGPGGVQTDAEYTGLTSFAITRVERRLDQIKAELEAA